MFNRGDKVRCVVETMPGIDGPAIGERGYVIEVDLLNRSMLVFPFESTGWWSFAKFELVSMGTGDPADGGLYPLPTGIGASNNPMDIYINSTENIEALKRFYDDSVHIQCPIIKTKPKCECGQKDEIGIKHSSWCPIKT